MIKKFLTPEVERFIRDHEGDDVDKVALKYHGSGLPIQFIADQIKGRQKQRSKLPSLIQKGLLFPSGKAAEQCSSELTAAFKASLFAGHLGVDLTGGLGVDTLFLARTFDRVVYVEKDEKVAEFAAENFARFGCDNIELINATAEEYLIDPHGGVDLIYADPDRRKGDDRLFQIEDCSPDILMLLPKVDKLAKNWCFKLSPMLDIASSLASLPGATGVELISVQNELKELVLMKKYGSRGIQYCTTDFIHGKQFRLQLEQNDLKVRAENGVLLSYLYEPRASLMKLGAFGWICKQYNVKQVGENSHLFTSEELNKDFPGKIFRVQEAASPRRDHIKRVLGENGATIATRNYPERPDVLRRKYRIAEGNDFHLFFTKMGKGDYTVIITEPIR